ncbi:MAG: hypothetical protein WBZ48_07795 [Bacteroidota bacterium]
MALAKRLLFISCIFGAAGLLMAGCSNTTQPITVAGRSADLHSSVAGSIIDDENMASHISGVPVDSSDGVFDIGWNPFVGPIAQDSERLGDASVVVFDTLATETGRRSLHDGEDIGSVSLIYSGNALEFRKIQHFYGGTFYSLFPHLFGNANPELTFVPNTTYEFEVSGSSLFPATKVSITSPPALIDITSDTNGQQINADSDLVLAWSGGNPVAGVLIRIIPMIVFGPDGFTHYGSGMRETGGGIPAGIHYGGPERSVQIDTGYTLVLASNSGNAVIPASAIQQLLYATSTLSVSVSEFSTVEFNQDSRKYLMVMRDGDRRMIVVK